MASLKAENTEIRELSRPNLPYLLVSLPAHSMLVGIEENHCNFVQRDPSDIMSRLLHQNEDSMQMF